MNIHSVYNVFLRHFRKKRMEAFMNMFQPEPQTRILDVGGTPYNWLLVRCPASIVFLNLTVQTDVNKYPPNFSFVQGDGKKLDFPEGAFDIVYSNSVIEHLNTFENQLRFAREIARVGKSIWVQTPAKFFPVEPHLVTPFIHYFPKSMQRKLIRNFTVWGIVTRPTQNDVDRFLDEVRLITKREMRELFSGCMILSERFMLLPKAFIAVKRLRDTRLQLTNEVAQ